MNNDLQSAIRICLFGKRMDIEQRIWIARQKELGRLVGTVQDGKRRACVVTKIANDRMAGSCVDPHIGAQCCQVLMEFVE